MRYLLLSQQNVTSTPSDLPVSPNLRRVNSLALHAVIDGIGSAKTFEDADVTVAADTITIASHGWYTGRAVAATSAGTLPAGLSETTYYVIRVDENTIQLATSLANALAGTDATISGAAGGGIHTLTPTAPSGSSVKLQKSNDGSNWVDVASATNITADASVMIEDADVGYSYARAVLTLGTNETFRAKLLLSGQEVDV